MREEMRAFFTAAAALTAMALIAETPARSAAAEPLGCINTDQGTWVTQILTIKRADQPPIPILGKLTSWNPQTGEIEVLVRGQTQPVKAKAPVTIEFSVRGPSLTAQMPTPEASRPVPFGPKAVPASDVKIADGFIVVGGGSGADGACASSADKETAFAGTVDFTTDTVRISGSFTTYSPPQFRPGPEDTVRRKGG
jgi:hypothetical protein